jgi:tight adherence protein B
MSYPFLIDIVLLVVCCAFLILLMVLGSYWYRHYSGHAKSLSKRLSDIVNLRSQPDSQLVKSHGEDLAGFENLELTTQVMEAIRLMILRADVDISVVKLLVISATFLLVGVLLFSVITSFHFFSLLISGLLFAAIPFAYIKRKEQKRRAQIEKQLPEALDFICRSLRVGHGLAVSFGMVGDELPNPIAKEFKNVFEEINFGLPFDEAMSNFAVRVNSADVNFLVVGLLIQREAGGNLIGLLENLAKTVRDRTILAGKVRVLASEGKYSGVLLSVLPFLIGGILGALNPAYMSVLWTTETGQHLIMFSLGMMALGGVWMWKITKIKV